MTQSSSPNVEIIAELAQGFEGKPEQAHLMVKAAASAGADAAKFQLVYADELATPGYQYYDLFKTLEMDDQVWASLAAAATEQDIALHVDIFGAKSLALAEKTGIGTVKLHGTDVANTGFLEGVAASTVPRVLLGAGGGHRGEIEAALDILQKKKVVVLLGFQAYPTPNETNQIARVAHLVSAFKGRTGDVEIGFADHAPPSEALRYALAATAIGAGAQVIEKHLTLGQVMKLEDHESALNPDEFAEFCETVRGCAEAFGTFTSAEDFGMSESENAYRNAIRRHVIASRDLESGRILEPADLVLKRSASQTPLTDIQSVYGRTLNVSKIANQPIENSDIK